MSQIFYRKDLIDRFWEERRQTAPNLSYLFNIVQQLSNIVELSEKDTLRVKEIVKASEEVELQKVSMKIDELDLMYHRVLNMPLSDEIDILGTYIEPKFLILAAQQVLRDLSEAVSICAILYSPEFPIKDVHEEETTWQ